MFKKMLAVMAIVVAGTTAHAEDRVTVGYRVDNFGPPKVACSAAARLAKSHKPTISLTTTAVLLISFSWV